MKPFVRSLLFAVAFTAGVASALPFKNATGVFTYRGEEFPVVRTEGVFSMWTPAYINGGEVEAAHGVIIVQGEPAIESLRTTMTNLAARVEEMKEQDKGLPHMPIFGSQPSGVRTSQTGWSLRDADEERRTGKYITVDSGMIQEGTIVFRLTNTSDGSVAVTLLGVPADGVFAGSPIPSSSKDSENFGNPFIDFGQQGTVSLREFADLLVLPAPGTPRIDSSETAPRAATENADDTGNEEADADGV